MVARWCGATPFDEGSQQCLTKYHSAQVRCQGDHARKSGDRLLNSRSRGILCFGGYYRERSGIA